MIPLDPFKYHKNIKEFEKDQNLALRNLFKTEIKPNFLIKIYCKIKEKLGKDLYRYCNPTFTMENSISGNIDNFEYDICKMIIGTHKSNMIFVEIEEQKKYLCSLSYEEKLVSDVIADIKLRQYGSSFFRQKQIMYGDRFLYFPLPYDLFVMCIRMNSLLSEKNSQQLPFPIFSKIADMGLASLSLLEDNLLNNIYPICRGIIELYIIYLSIYNNKKAMEKYIYLTKIETEQSQCGKPFPQKFYEMFENRMKKESYNDPPHPFLHFGWVDELKDYHKIVKRKPYTISGLIKYLNYINHTKDFDTYDIFYQKCHSYTHASIVTTYPLLSYFEICIMLYLTIINTYQFLCESLNIDTSINDVDIISKAIKDYESLIEQYHKRTTENFDKYYNNVKQNT